MARLIYSAIASLDGYTADASGGFEWAAPGAEVHAFVNDLEREAGTYLYGRRMYETMAVWETLDVSADAGADARVRRDLARRRQGRLLAHARARRRRRGRGSSRARPGGRPAS